MALATGDLSLLKKKLAKAQHKNHDENGSSPSDHMNPQPPSKGLWERRLQIDIQTAKRALCEALSLDKSSGLNPSFGPKIIPKIASPIQTSNYASSAENIARLLENWTKDSSRNICQLGSADDATQSISFNNPYSGGPISSPSEGQMSNLTFAGPNPMNSEAEQEVATSLCAHENGVVQDHEGKVTQMPFSLLEEWLFDDAAGQVQAGKFMEMALGQTADLFGERSGKGTACNATSGRRWISESSGPLNS